MVNKESCCLNSLQRRVVAVAGGADHKQPLAVKLVGSSSVKESLCSTECLSWGGPYPGTDLWGVPKASHFDSLRDKSDRLVSCTPKLSMCLAKALLGLPGSLTILPCLNHPGGLSISQMLMPDKHPSHQTLLTFCF